MNEGRVKAFQFIEGGARYGAAVSLLNIAEGMRQSAVDVEFGVFAGRPLGDVMRERGFVVHEIRANGRVDFRGISQLVKLFRTRRFDIVHTHLSRATVNGTVAARLARVPVVSTVHGMNKKYTYMLANHVMTVSEAAKRHLVNQGIPSDRVTAVYNCITLDGYNDLPSMNEGKLAYGFDSGSVVLGTVSRAHQQKGIDVAIQAVAELRKRGIDAKYLFIGDGPHIEEFRSLVANLNLGDHVRFPGFAESVPEALAVMDVFLFPTHREAFGISLLEAMAARVPVVASAIDGVPEVLAEGSGILLDQRTPQAFADAAEMLLRDHDKRGDVIQKARARVEQVFSVEQTAKAVEQVYAKAIRAAQVSPRKGRRDLLWQTAEDGLDSSRDR